MMGWGGYRGTGYARGVLGLWGPSTGLLGSPVQRHLRTVGVQASEPPPAPPARSIRIVVKDSAGLGCEGAEYALTALRGMAASVWVTHAESGSFQVTEDGRDTRLAGTLAARYRRGEELVITAEGPDAGRALQMVRALLEAHPGERRNVYRRMRQTRKGSTT